MNNAVILTIYDKTGACLGEFKDAEFQSALWRLGQTGVAKYAFSPGGGKVTRSNLRPGNRALIEFGDGLPDWGGVLDWPINVASEQDIGITFYEGDRILGWRVSGQNEVYSSTAVGAIVSALVENANATYQTGLYMGDVYGGGTAQSRDYHYTSLLEAVRGLQDESGFDYAVVPAVVGGKLVFDLYWYERRGTDRRDELALIEGANFGTISASEQGPVYNRFIVIGKGSDWNENRPVKVSEDAESRSRYGLREAPKLYLDISDETTLQAIADALLAGAMNPYVRCTLQGVANEEPAPFANYHVGDILTLQALQTYGEFAYDFPVRILSRSRLADGTCTLEVERWWAD
jgi:hypothetical protein